MKFPIPYTLIDGDTFRWFRTMDSCFYHKGLVKDECKIQFAYRYLEKEMQAYIVKFFGVFATMRLGHWEEFKDGLVYQFGSYAEVREWFELEDPDQVAEDDHKPIIVDDSAKNKKQTEENLIKVGQKIEENLIEVGQKVEENLINVGQKIEENLIKVGQEIEEKCKIQEEEEELVLETAPIQIQERDPKIMEDNEPIPQQMILICGHQFHVHCLRLLLEQPQACPTCRALIVPPENAKSEATGQRGLHQGSQQSTSSSVDQGESSSFACVRNDNLSRHHARLQAAASAASMFGKLTVYPSKSHLKKLEAAAE